MANTIKRTTRYMEVEIQRNVSAFGEGEVLFLWKEDNRWITKDSNGKRYHFTLNFLRNPVWVNILTNYTKADIIYWLQEQNEDYYTVAWDYLSEAIDTTLKESNPSYLGDIYEYISENLIQ